MDNQAVEIDFMGQKIKMRSESDMDLVQEVLDLAQIKIRDAKKRGRNAAPHYVALMALFDLAEDYVRAKRKVTDQRKDLIDKTNALTSLLDAAAK